MRITITGGGLRHFPERRFSQLFFSLDPVLLIASIRAPVLIPKFIRTPGDFFVRDIFTNLPGSLFPDCFTDCP
ncbi:MAG: hypothetical protein QM760_10290 [Nibricoccus sp.]